MILRLAPTALHIGPLRIPLPLLAVEVDFTILTGGR